MNKEPVKTVEGYEGQIFFFPLVLTVGIMIVYDMRTMESIPLLMTLIFLVLLVYIFLQWTRRHK